MKINFDTKYKIKTTNQNSFCLFQNELKRNLVNAEEANVCSECHHNHDTKIMNTKKKLLALLLIAILALLSIVIISEQLIVRRLYRLESVHSTGLTILTLDEWTPKDISVQSRGTLYHQNGFKVIEDGLFWSSDVENRIFQGK